jgi:hypothetical protein
VNGMIWPADRARPGSGRRTERVCDQLDRIEDHVEATTIGKIALHLIGVFEDRIEHHIKPSVVRQITLHLVGVFDDQGQLRAVRCPSPARIAAADGAEPAPLTTGQWQ